MPLIIDVFNVVHTAGVLPPELASMADVEGLARLLGVSRYRNERIELVCDGSPPMAARSGGPGAGVVKWERDEEPAERVPLEEESTPRLLNVHYSGPGREADEVIAMFVQHSTAPRLLTVVSSDAAVLRTARRRKCRTLTSQQFLEHLASDYTARETGLPRPMAKPPDAMNAEQVEAWMALFEVDEAETERLMKARPAKKAPDPKPHAKAERPPENRDDVLPKEIVDEAERLLRERRGSGE